ncbi:MAG: hypothetical protein ACYTDY_13725 [Planctomycetota bacterium]
MVKLGFESSYQTIMTYAPPRLQEILVRELPQIEENIEREANKFGAELGEFVAGEATKLADEIVHDQSALEMQIRTVFEKLEGAVAGEAEQAKAAFENLKKTLNEHEKKWRDVGSKLRGVVLTAVRSAGVPVPGSLF